MCVCVCVCVCVCGCVVLLQGEATLCNPARDGGLLYMLSAMNG